MEAVDLPGGQYLDRRYFRAPDPVPTSRLHERQTQGGSRVKAAGTREARSGRRRDYWCFPAGGKQHKLAVIIHAPDRIVPSYSTPPDCPTHGVNGTVVRDGT